MVYQMTMTEMVIIPLAHVPARLMIVMIIMHPSSRELLKYATRWTRTVMAWLTMVFQQTMTEMVSQNAREIAMMMIQIFSRGIQKFVMTVWIMIVMLIRLIYLTMMQMDRIAV